MCVGSPSAQGERGRDSGEREEPETRSATDPSVAEHQGIGGLRDVVARCRNQNGDAPDVARDRVEWSARQAQHEGSMSTAPTIEARTRTPAAPRCVATQRVTTESTRKRV